jgi:hypothetical protein
VSITDETLLPSKEDADQQNQNDLKHKVKQIKLNQIMGPGKFVQICDALGTY